MRSCHAPIALDPSSIEGKYIGKDSLNKVPKFPSSSWRIDFRDVRMRERISQISVSSRKNLSPGFHALDTCISPAKSICDFDVRRTFPPLPDVRGIPSRSTSDDMFYSFFAL